MTNNKGKLKFLSLDGGGIRGATTAAFLQQLNQFLLNTKNQTIGDYFDGFVGTSTGGLIALCIAGGFPGNNLTELYNKSNADRIFTKNPIIKVYDAKYTAEKRIVFTEIFDKLGITNTKLSNLKKYCAVTSYNLTKGKASILSSIVSNNTISDISVLDSADCTSAAPTYFPPVKSLINGEEDYLIDGGVIANQPSTIAYSLAEFIDREKCNKKDIKILSVGTSQNPITISGTGHQNEIAWLPSILEIASDTSIFDINSQAILGDAFLRINSGTKFTFNGVTVTASPELDDVSQSNIDNLNDLGKLWWLAFESKIAKFIDL